MRDWAKKDRGTCASEGLGHDDEEENDWPRPKAEASLRGEVPIDEAAGRGDPNTRTTSTDPT